MGSIRRAPRTKRWEARYRDPRGAQRTATFDRKADAQVFLAAIEADMRRGVWRSPDAGRFTFAEVATAWLDSNPAKRLTTLARDTTVVRVHLLPVLGVMRLDQLRPSDVKATVDAMASRGLGARTIRTNYGVLRAILAWAGQDDLIARTPCRGIGLPEVAKTPKPIASADGIARLVDAVPADYRVAVLLGAMGLREAEVFGLRVGSIDFLRRSVTVQATINEIEGRFVEGDGKTNASVRTISLPRLVTDELAAHLARTGRTDPSELVLQAPHGGPVRAANFRLRVYDPATRAAGLEGLTFHRLRHSAGHIMRAAGVPLEVIQRRLGHASIRTTADVYGSLPESVDRAVADQLDGLFHPSRGADVVQGGDSTGAP